MGTRIRPSEHLLDVYRPPEGMAERVDCVRLDRNERVDPFPAAAFREMLASLDAETFSTYPNPAPLYRRLGRELDLPEEYVHLTPGSDAAIRMVFHAFVRPGDAVVLADPSYAMYPVYAKIFQASPRMVAYDADRRLDVDRLFGLLAGGPRLLALANPDQPTGTVLAADVLRHLAERAREVGTLCLIDEAYYPFHPETMIALTRELDNVVVTRSFSKVGGLAGLRLGYLAAQPDLIQHVQRVRGAHEVNAVAIAVGCYVADHPELGAEYLGQVEAGRAALAAAARELRLGFPECRTNFQLLRIPGATDTSLLVSALKARGYLVKGGFTSPAVRNCLRVTLASPAVMRGFVAALRGVLKQGEGPA